MSTLYIVEQGSALRVKHQQFQVLQQQQLLLKVPVIEIKNIVILGYCHLSYGAVQTALYRRIPVVYYSAQGYFQGALQAREQLKTLYLIEQIKRQRDAEFIRRQALNIVKAKLINSRIFLLRNNQAKDNPAIRQAAVKIKQIINSLDNTASLESIRGYEGKGASIYFQGLGGVFQRNFNFSQRSSRPPKDPINSLLGFGYTLLCQHLISTVQLAGLHSDFGNLHDTRDHHPSLVLDLMEEFRAQIVDSLVVYLVNNRIISLEDFTKPDTKGGVYLKRDSLKIFLKHWTERLSQTRTHPQSQHNVNLRVCLELQVNNYIDCLMGEKEIYQPMIWKK